MLLQFAHRLAISCYFLEGERREVFCENKQNFRFFTVKKTDTKVISRCSGVYDILLLVRKSKNLIFLSTRYVLFTETME